MSLPVRTPTLTFATFFSSFEVQEQNLENVYTSFPPDQGIYSKTVTHCLIVDNSGPLVSSLKHLHRYMTCRTCLKLHIDWNTVCLAVSAMSTNMIRRLSFNPIITRMLSVKAYISEMLKESLILI